jgi:uncharacterized membrane protein
MAGRLALLGLGAALMYLMDPQAGRKRRADLQDQLHATERRIQRGKELLEHPDELRARMNSMLGPWGKPRWSPTERALAASLGTGLAMGGFARGGARGIVMLVLGAGLVARAAANRGLASLARREAIPVQKTLRIAKPVAEVFAYWRDLENFPLWMSHVQEVRYVGGDRYHWKVDGPAGVPVEWEAELLNVVQDAEMTWRSVPGSAVRNTGRVRFEADGDGTRVHVLVRYQPPGGRAGDAVARFFGADPGSEMDDDLARLKSLIEDGQVARDTAFERRLEDGGSGLGAAPA